MKQIVLIIIAFNTAFSFAQNTEVEWLSFEELESELVNEPKKVMIHFYADWCDYCKKMERSVYTKPEIAHVLNANYYTVKFDVESQETIYFGESTFINSNIGKKRNAYHQIAELLANRKDKALTLPTIVFFNEKFEIEQRQFRYIAPDELLSLLKD